MRYKCLLFNILIGIKTNKLSATLRVCVCVLRSSVDLTKWMAYLISKC